MWDYPKIDRAFLKLKINEHPAWAHGLLCAMRCAQNLPDEAGWLAEIVHHPENIEDGEKCIFTEIFTATVQQFNLQTDFELLLAEDNAPLKKRARALRSWCSGFLSGLGIRAVAIETKKSIVRDLHAVAKLDERIRENPQNSDDFENVVQFVRQSVLEIYRAKNPAGEI